MFNGTISSIQLILEHILEEAHLGCLAGARGLAHLEDAARKLAGPFSVSMGRLFIVSKAHIVLFPKLRGVVCACACVCCVYALYTLFLCNADTKPLLCIREKKKRWQDNLSFSISRYQY